LTRPFSARCLSSALTVRQSGPSVAARPVAWQPDL